MTTRISPNFRQQILCPQQVSVNTTLTGMDAYKVWTHTVVGTITFTLPAAKKGAGPMYFCEQLSTNVIVVQPQATDHIVGLGAGVPTTLNLTGSFLGLFCELDGTWSVVTASTGSGGVGFTGFADPTGFVKLTQTPGSATTALRSDSAPALDVTISPTWTGNHIFAPTSGIGVAIRSIDGTQSLQAGIVSGTKNPRLFLTHTEATGLTDLAFTGSSAPQGTISIGNTAVIALSNNRNVTINAPASGTALTVTNLAGAGTAATIQSNPGTGKFNFDPSDASGGYTCTFRLDATGVRIGHNSAARNLTFGCNSTDMLTIGAGGNVTINTPTSGVGLTIAGGGLTVTGTVIFNTPLAATSGGTGFAVYAIGDILYANTTTTLAKLADVAAGSYLRSGGVGANPVWSTVTIPNAAVLGDIWYGSAASAISALAGTISATKQFLTQTGTGAVSAAPAWGTLATADIPALGANPTAKVGTAAVNGVATTYIRSDGAPAVDLAMVPTWTGAHTFSALLTANLGITVAGATLKVAVGTTTLAPITMQSGTNLTTATAGVLEYDGTAFYSTPAASSRAVATTEYVCVMNGTKTLVSQTAAQAIFNSTTNGAVTLPIGTYIFECQFQLTAMSTVTGGFGFALGGAATFTQGWSSLAVNAAAVTASNAQMTYNTAANTAIATASTAGVAHAMVKGIIRVTVAGTVIPQVSLITAAAAVVAINSYFKCYPVGNGTATTVGNWS